MHLRWNKLNPVQLMKCVVSFARSFSIDAFNDASYIRLVSSSQIGFVMVRFLPGKVLLHRHRRIEAPRGRRQAQRRQIGGRRFAAGGEQVRVFGGRCRRDGERRAGHAAGRDARIVLDRFDLGALRSGKRQRESKHAFGLRELCRAAPNLCHTTLCLPSTACPAQTRALNR